MDFKNDIATLEENYSVVKRCRMCNSYNTAFCLHCDNMMLLNSASVRIVDAMVQLIDNGYFYGLEPPNIVKDSYFNHTPDLSGLELNENGDLCVDVGGDSK